MSRSSQLCRRAQALYQAGKQEDARRVLQAVLREEPSNEVAWRLYAKPFEKASERKRVWEQYLNAQAGILVSNRAVPGSTVAPARPGVNGKRALYGQNASFYSVLVLFVVTFGVLITGGLHHLTATRIQEFENRQLQGQYQALEQENKNLVDISVNLMGERDQFHINYDRLEGEYAGLQDRYNVLGNQFNVLKGNYDTLFAEHNSLIEQYNSLQMDYNGLVDNHNAVLGQLTDLQRAYNEQVNEYDQLLDRAVTPPYIAIDDRLVHIAFYKTDRSIGHWQVTFEGLEKDITRGYESRKNNNASIPRKQLESETEGPIRLKNYAQFVDSALFTKVIPQLYQESTDEYAFIWEVWNIVHQLTTYSNEIQDTPRYPLETFLAGGGDCEDTTILLASMILAAPVNWDVDLFFMDGDNPYDPQEMNHVIIYIFTGSREYYIETTSDNMLPYEMAPLGWRDHLN